MNVIKVFRFVFMKNMLKESMINPLIELNYNSEDVHGFATITYFGEHYRSTYR